MISKKTVNAVELCVLLASQRGGDYLTTAELAPRLDLSISYLENILKPLKDNDIVLSIFVALLLKNMAPVQQQRV